MKKCIVFIALVFLALASKAQLNYFIYLQTDNKQAFSVKMNGKDLSSSASGYIVIPKLPKGEHSFTISFPKNEWPKQSFNVLLNNNDEGYMLKNFSDKGWGLFNLQSMDIVMNGDPIKKAKVPTANDQVEIIKIPEVVKETTAVTKVIVPEVKIVETPIVKEVETPIVKVATNNANRAPVLTNTTEPEIVKTTPKIVEKAVEVMKETPTPKVEEKIIEIPIVKVEEKIAEKIVETPKVKVEEKITEKPVVKIEEKIAEKIVETPKEKIKEIPTIQNVDKVVEVAEEAATEKLPKKSSDKITKVNSFDDTDGTTITYRVESQSGVDIVPIFLEKNGVASNGDGQATNGEKFIEHIELANPNAKKAENTEDPTKAKVATNNVNRAPVEEKVKEKIIEKVEPPVVVEKVKEIEKVVVPITAKVKEIERVEVPVTEKVKVIEKVEAPVVEKVKVIEKVETPIIEKSVENGVNNPLKITEAEKSSKTTMNKTAINSDCTNKNATEEDFFKTRKKIIAEDNDDARIEAALKQFKINCYSVEQIKNLAILFLSDIGKYKLVDAAYPYTYQSNLYSSLEPLFIDVYYLNRFRAMLQR